MVTQYNSKDMVLFANHMMHLVSTGQKKADPSGLYQVSHADFENWKIRQDFDKGLIENIQTICEESLDPESFEKWQEIKEVLKESRKL